VELRAKVGRGGGWQHGGGELRQHVARVLLLVARLVVMLPELEGTGGPLGELEVRVALCGLELDVREFRVHNGACAADAPVGCRGPWGEGGGGGECSIAGAGRWRGRGGGHLSS
jgi:hypothetical protein